MKNRLKFVIFLFLVISIKSLKAQQVYLIPTIHKLHNVNKNYSYDSLKAVISRIKPDIIAVEIRPEDIKADTEYLGKSYPREMVMMRYWFPDNVVVGFDWLADGIKGKSIPVGYWKTMSPIKKFEQALYQDSLYMRKCAVCDTFFSQRSQLLEKLSLKELLRSADAQLTNNYYQCLANELNGSIHQRVLNFYDQRNKLILQNIRAIIKRYKGKKIVVLTGDDHYVYLDDLISHQPLPL